jgi:hypothetical protein
MEDDTGSAALADMVNKRTITTRECEVVTLDRSMSLSVKLGHSAMSAQCPVCLKVDVDPRSRDVAQVPTTDSCTAANDAPFDYVVGTGVNDPPPARSKAVIRPSLRPSLPADH